MRLVRTIWLALALALGCGARSALEVEPPDDAGSTLDTLPCRWGVGEPLELARGASFDHLAGAIDPDVDLAVVSARRGPESVGALVVLSQTPARRASFDGQPGRLFSGARGYLRQDDTRCGAVLYDGALVELDRFTWDSADCSLAQSRVGRLESFRLGIMGAASVVTIVDWPSAAPPESDTILELDYGYRGGVFVRAPDDDYFGAWSDGYASFGRLTRTGTFETRARVAEGVSGAPDRLRGGAVFLYWSPELGWELLHIDALVRATEVADLTELRADPIGSVVTNETEVLFPLVDGSIAYVPLNRALIRYVEPFVEGVAFAMEIFLRPGSSVGLVLYVHRTPDGNAALVYRTLVCNR